MSGSCAVGVERYPEGPSSDLVAIEEPLQIRVERQSLAVTMRTPGHDLDLVAGFLLTEALVDGADDVSAMARVADNTVDVRLASGVAGHEVVSRASRALFSTSSCGVCGKASLEHLHQRVGTIIPHEPDPRVLCTLPAALRASQPTYAGTGGLHAAALFDFGGTLEVLREDIGRHNAVDKVLGFRLRQDRVPVSDRILCVSSRAGFEIVQKAAVAGVPVVAALGAASSLAIELAKQSGIALIGFLRDDRFNRYA